MTPGAVTGGSTDPLYLDVNLTPEVSIEVPVAAGHTAIAYVYEGEAKFGNDPIGAGRLAVFSDGDRVVLTPGGEGVRLLLLAGRPLGERVAQYGPFVMNTAEELEQAMRDYREGRLTA